ncbi:hypothetical protein MUA77_04140 [Mammaliicoccus sciuri]|uniref:hypothetical protein n=1 Tax=Mammaliicoccus sciuri TaxID=1296 RepID=UPI0021CFF2FB|nr:hypothetical protein [Mammaliicoccus sciuri]UXU84624.1 hypothetical protein MUA77_04140 [Mammaliicoccus sciuri]UXU94472.1 hypothetical protein MUA42_04150 [Mammaliicoccus sciuri]UXV16420.1 hypothetical protein MUA89_04145 [Mammaliicoccus sciuri]UXV24682.1 hypothetical protein MUA49_04145 [Mammaliicoccus sciuri]UXV27466.1 hypothetical protein MUA96_04145 [Mammaliicoccus sciuri]
MKYYLIILIVSLIALYTFIKQSYKYASVQDEVEKKKVGLNEWGSFRDDMPEIQAGDVIEHRYTPENGIEHRILRAVPPIDYEDTQSYKDNEPWFTGMGRC